jgi:hypothetical protein
MVKRKLTVGGLIGYLASVSHFHCFCCVFVFPHAISLWNMIPGSLLLILIVTSNTEMLPAHLRFPKTIKRCAQSPNNSCTSAVGTKSFPAPASNVACSVNSVRSLLRQPRSALEAGPSEAHAISFFLTPRPHLHRKDCTFSVFCPFQEDNGTNTHWAEASSIFGAGGFGW